MAQSFTAQLKEFAKMTKANMRYVAAEAIQDVVEAAQTPQLGVTKGGTMEVGKIPVAEAELINSLSTNGGSPDSDSYVVAIASFEIGDVMTFAWTAPHALPMETGYSIEREDGGRTEVPGRHYVGFNARRFSDFVRAREAEVRT